MLEEEALATDAAEEEDLEVPETFIEEETVTETEEEQE